LELNVKLSEEREERMMGLEPTTFCMATRLRKATGSAGWRQSRIYPTVASSANVSS